MDIPNLITYFTECISAPSINKFCICDLITVYVSKYKYLETTFYFLCRYIHVILTLESSNFVKIVSNFLQCFFSFFFHHQSFVSVAATPFSSLSSLTNNITNSKKQCIVPDKIILIRYEIIKI